MAVSRLADRQIRAAQQAALKLDVRGPVSEALSKTGIVVAAEPTAPPAPSASAPRPTRPPRGVRAAERVVKPFTPAPWPTKPSASAAPAALSGLTADERRVHRILLDTLAAQRASGGTDVTALSYAERQALATLDLPFIDAELARMDGGGAFNTTAARWTIGLGAAVASLLVTVAALTGSGALEVPLLLALAAAGVVLLSVVVGMGGMTPTSPQRKQIYRALRELALLTDHDDATSEALTEADRLIDRLALDDGPAPSETVHASPSRVHS